MSPDEQSSPDAPEQHAPVAEKAQEAIVGDNGLREQQPPPSDTFNPNAVLQGSQPPQAQSGVPLQEDKAAGVQPNPEMSGYAGAPSLQQQVAASAEARGDVPPPAAAPEPPAAEGEQETVQPTE
jgi:hypothetical protein